MNALIFTGGDCDYAALDIRPEKDDLLIAADSGYRHAEALGIRPHLVVGDFDSFDRDRIPDGVEVVTVPAQKDFTDTQLAVNQARERGARHIRIIGGLGARLDHTLSCLAILENLHEKGDRLAVIENGFCRARLLNADSAIIPRSTYKYLSLIALDPMVKGVEIDGVKYPLKNQKLYRTFQYAVSNEITGNCAFVAVKKGKLLILETRE